LIEDLSDFDHVTIWQGSSQGRGGIASKIEAIKHAAKAKVPTWITSGSDFDGLSHFFKGFSKRSMPKTGTFVLAGEEPWKNS
jgi:glutamate 5-kinase